VKIGPVDTEIALLIVKKRKKDEITEGKIYIPFGKFAERAKLRTASSKMTVVYNVIWISLMVSKLNCI